MFKRITMFYVAALGLTILLAGLQQVTGLSATFVLPQWGPGLAALLMLLLFRRDGLSLRPAWRAAGVGRYAGALALPLLGAAMLWPLVARFVASVDVAPMDVGGGLRSLSPLWLAGMLFGALGEEIGWRGYLQPVVRGRWNAAATSLLVGALWALWHVQSWANGPLFMACLVAALVGYSLAITALIDDVPGARLPLAVLFHLGINVGLSFFGDLVSQTGFMALNAAVWLGLGVALIGLRRPATRRSPLATPHS